MEIKNHVDADAGALGDVLPLVAGEVDDALGNFAEVDLAALAVVTNAGVFLNAAHHGDAVEGGATNGLEAVLAVWAGLFEQGELGAGEDGGEQVVEVVGDAAGHLAEGAELLGANEGVAHAALGGDVADDGDPAGLALAGGLVGVVLNSEHQRLGAEPANLGYVAGEIVGGKALADGTALVQLRELVAETRADEGLDRHADGAGEGAVGADDAAILVADADTVGDGVEGLFPGALAIRELLEEAGVLKGGGSLTGEGFQEAQVLGAEAAGRTQDDVEGADDSPLAEQRDTGDGADRPGGGVGEVGGAMPDDDALASSDGLAGEVEARQGRARCLVAVGRPVANGGEVAGLVIDEGEEAPVGADQTGSGLGDRGEEVGEREAGAEGTTALVERGELVSPMGGLLVQTGVFDGEGGVAGDALDDGNVAWGEGVGGARLVDRDDPERASLADERDEQDGADVEELDHPVGQEGEVAVVDDERPAALDHPGDEGDVGGDEQNRVEDGELLRVEPAAVPGRDDGALGIVAPDDAAGATDQARGELTNSGEDVPEVGLGGEGAGDLKEDGREVGRFALRDVEAGVGHADGDLLGEGGDEPLVAGPGVAGLSEAEQQQHFTLAAMLEGDERPGAEVGNGKRRDGEHPSE